MEKIKVFFGPAQSGKTESAKKMAEGKRVHWMKALDKGEVRSKYFFAGIDKGIQLIVIDDVPPVGIRDVMSCFFNPSLIVHEKGQKAFEMPRPDVIIITTASLSELPSDQSTLRRFEYIEHPLPSLATPAIPAAKEFYYFSFRVNKKKIKGKIEASSHREAWQKVLQAVDTLEKLGGLSVTDVTIPPRPKLVLDLSQLNNQ